MEGGSRTLRTYLLRPCTAGFDPMQTSPSQDARSSTRLNTWPAMGHTDDCGAVSTCAFCALLPGSQGAVEHKPGC